MNRTHRTPAILVPLALVLAALLPSSAVAGPTGPAATSKTVKAKNVVSPSGEISCSKIRGSKRIECSASYIEDQGDLDTVIELGVYGRASYAQVGDFRGSPTPARTLRYGDVWTPRFGIGCTMRRSGLDCVNLSRHGFHISRGSVYLF